MPLKKSAKTLVDEANALVETRSVDAARALHARGEVLFVDLRDVRELEREGVIPGAVHAPRGMLEFWVDPESPYAAALLRRRLAFGARRAQPAGDGGRAGGASRRRLQRLEGERRTGRGSARQGARRRLSLPWICSSICA